jgi:hypothetical protein
LAVRAENAAGGSEAGAEGSGVGSAARRATQEGPRWPHADHLAHKPVAALAPQDTLYTKFPGVPKQEPAMASGVGWVSACNADWDLSFTSIK